MKGTTANRRRTDGKTSTQCDPGDAQFQLFGRATRVKPVAEVPIRLGKASWMTGDRSFSAAYRALEARMKELAEADGAVFLPNPEPVGPVDYVFLCMEPSLGGWASSPDGAKKKVEAGFRNFLSSMEDFLLHFAIREYLCGDGQRYHITDLSKGAMLVKRARIARTERYDRWYGLLIEELDLVTTPGAKVIAVGRDVARQLERRGFARLFTTILHYSGQAARARAEGIVGHEDRYEAFCGSVSLPDVLATAQEVMLDSLIPMKLRNETLARLAKNQLSPSRTRLIFNYKLAFETMKAVPSK